MGIIAVHVDLTSRVHRHQAKRDRSTERVLSDHAGGLQDGHLDARHGPRKGLFENVTMETMQPAPEPFWHAFKDEELLALRICDLGVRIEHSELNPRIEQLYSELAARGVALRPDCYLGDEWFSPEGVPAISIPFYLAHPRL
jgi:hypothetical protein